MNGDNRRAILADNVQWPNGLAIDYDSDRIFWTDAMLHKIESADFDGGNRRMVSSRLIVRFRRLNEPMQVSVSSH